MRCDEDRPDVLKALIIGPEGTPYENGCFEFDLLLPATYPEQPPEVLLVTTGGGSVRFNPNLYNCGKVCLSLLGTWAGPGWDRETSSMLQVLVSIQSLILVPDPYFNEPGWESSMGTPEGIAKSSQYNAKIRQETVRVAMIETLRKPSLVFADVIRQHFSMKQQQVFAQVRRWGDECARVPLSSARRRDTAPFDADAEYVVAGPPLPPPHDSFPSFSSASFPSLPTGVAGGASAYGSTSNTASQPTTRSGFKQSTSHAKQKYPILKAPKQIPAGKCAICGRNFLSTDATVDTLEGLAHPQCATTAPQTTDSPIGSRLADPIGVTCTETSRRWQEMLGQLKSLLC